MTSTSMIRFEETTFIAAPIDRVFDYRVASKSICLRISMATNKPSPRVESQLDWSTSGSRSPGAPNTLGSGTT